MLERNVAEGVHRVEDAYTNWYLVEEGNQLTVVDAGLPRSWRSLESALAELGRSLNDIEAVVLTHGHFDHAGFARRAKEDLGVPVWAHTREQNVLLHPWRYDHEHSRLPYLRHPHFVRVLGAMTAMGVLGIRGAASSRTFDGGQRLDLPGRPEMIFTPGHTHGHCSLLLADRGVLIAGDAFVMLDPYTGRRGPCIVAGAATADQNQALASVEALAELDVGCGLTGHGPAWNGTMAEAAQRAMQAGPA